MRLRALAGPISVSLAFITGLTLGVPPTPAAAGPAGYQLSWADEFAGTAVDSSRWTFRADKPWNADSEQRPENVTVGGGVMTIQLCPKGRSGPACIQAAPDPEKYTGGGLISRDRLRYGYYETRAKINIGGGWHSAFWSAEQGGTGPRTEIDGFEIDSHAPGLIQHNIIGWDQGARLGSGLYGVGFDTSAGWHVYGFEWLESGVRFYVDGQLAKFQPSYPQSGYAHNYLNLWLTAIAIDFDDSIDVASPGQVSFDYARYYQRDVYGDNDDPAGGFTETGSGWSNSSLTSFARLTNRYNCTSAATAEWTLRPPGSGSYRAYFFRVGGDGGQVDAPVTVAGGATTLATATVDLSSAGNDWVPIGGTLTLTGGHPYAVRIDRTGAGCIRADAVKFVRV